MNLNVCIHIPLGPRAAKGAVRESNRGHFESAITKLSFFRCRLREIHHE